MSPPDPSSDAASDLAAARSVVARCPAFAELSPETLDELARRMRPVRWEPGETIIRRGDAGDFLMIVETGQAHVEIRDLAGTLHTTARFGEHTLVGEMALITKQTRTADVVADTAVRAFVLSTPDFDDVASAFPELGMVVTHVVADRLGQQDVDGLNGRTVDRYRVLRCVGRGGMAVVYEGEDTESGERVALKMMSHSLIFERGALARFQREAAVLEGVVHPNIARIHRRFHAFRTYFIAMEFCQGPTLAQYLEERGALPEPAVRALVGQLADALATVHARGVVHRDLKPANVLVTDGGVLKLADFGLAKPVVVPAASAVTEANVVLGTPFYMAPEALVGTDAGTDCDVYSLGCVALEALTGRCPFRATSFSDLVVEKRRFEMPPAEAIGPGISPEMHAFISRALAVSPEMRMCDLTRLALWSAPLPR